MMAQKNVPAGTVVGTFSTIDPDGGDTFTYTLVPGDSSEDNDNFTIEEDDLKIAVVPDYETKSSYSIRVRSTDSFGLYTEKQFNITGTDVNEAPTDITLSNSSVPENTSVGSVVGYFSTICDIFSCGRIAKF